MEHVARKLEREVTRLQEENAELREEIEDLEQEAREPGLADIFAGNALELLGRSEKLEAEKRELREALGEAVALLDLRLDWLSQDEFRIQRIKSVLFAKQEQEGE